MTAPVTGARAFAAVLTGTTDDLFPVSSRPVELGWWRSFWLALAGAAGLVPSDQARTADPPPAPDEPDDRRPDVEQLLLALGDEDGSDAAAVAIVERFNPLVLETARRLGLGTTDAQDVAQNTWLTFFQNVDTVAAPSRLPAWIATTARREAIRLIGRRRREVPLGLGTDVLADSDLYDPVLRRERERAVQQAVAELSPRDRDLLDSLFAEEPLGYREISSTLGIPIGSIGPLRSKLLSRLRARLSELTENERGGDSHR
jgi:RNA polymerase sigma factor (sigma-70 family)